MARTEMTTESVIRFLDLTAIARAIKECEESEQIEKNILDKGWRKSGLHKALLPLYIIYKYHANAFDLSSGEITTILRRLSLTTHQPDVSRSLKDAAKYLIADKDRYSGSRMRFRLSRPGGRYMETVVAGAAAPSFEGAILPPESVAGTRKYIEQMVQEINGSYGYGWYDATAVICRRLMESLIIEIYVSQRRQDEIRSGGTYVALEKLIRYLCSDKTISLGRSTPKGMNHIKELGDTAAHDRTYITQRPDIDDARPEIRKVVSELLILAGIAK